MTNRSAAALLAVPYGIVVSGWGFLTGLALTGRAPAPLAPASALTAALGVYLVVQALRPAGSGADDTVCPFGPRRFRPFSPALFTFWATGGAVLLMLRLLAKDSPARWTSSGLALVCLLCALWVWDAVPTIGLAPRDDVSLDRRYAAAGVAAGGVLIAGGLTLAAIDHHLWFALLALPGAAAVMGEGRQFLSPRAADYFLVMPFLAAVIGMLIHILFVLTSEMLHRPLPLRWTVTLALPLALWLLAILRAESRRESRRPSADRP